MSVLIKVISIALVVLVAILILKQLKPEFALFIGLAGALCISFLLLDTLKDAITIFTNIVNKTGVNFELIKIVLKIIGLGYLTEFASSLCADSGASSISDKILLTGKLVVLVEVLPIVSNLINMLLEIVK